ncbi:unnamed protein product [Miscanthus lutarioriparius]|uniref:Uncharacterized protein n=1 Tax=Miscanthus lutarioriparius TaxID=422564 RepID=A0A811QMN5_9POAL|nr:unnamed protein product [Miscanthus lutarioriparius]
MEWFAAAAGLEGPGLSYAVVSILGPQGSDFHILKINECYFILLLNFNRLDLHLTVSALFTWANKEHTTKEWVICNLRSDVKAPQASGAIPLISKGASYALRKLEQKWRNIAWFPMFDWVGGRTLEMSSMGLLPVALQGIDIKEMIVGTDSGILNFTV